MYTRPESIPFPSTWRTFEAPGFDGNPTTYEIRDLIDKDLDRAITMMTKYYIPDEPVSKVLKVHEDPGSVEDFQDWWRETQLQKISIACYESKSNVIVGVNFLSVIRKDDPKKEKKLKGTNDILVFEFYDWIFEKFGGFEFFGTDQYITEFGLGTHSSYRRRGIATELLKARGSLMKALGIKDSSTGFSAKWSQKAGEKAGYVTRLKFSYDELIKLGYPFEGIENEKYIFTTFSID